MNPPGELEHALLWVRDLDDTIRSEDLEWEFVEYLPEEPHERKQYP